MIGTQISQYRLVEKLGEGGMGVVYKAIDTLLDRVVAIKLVSAERADNEELLQRFKSEAKVQATLSHPNIATLYSYLVWEGRAVMVMEFIEGETIQQMIMRRGPIPADVAIPLFKQALLGVGAAHKRGIVHRDMKPANIMVNTDGLVKVMDFGIAKVLGVTGTTRTNLQMGTAWYMAPEQVLNRPVDARTDIYSLGVTLYEILSGQVPFRADSEYEVLSSHVQREPKLPTEHYPHIPRSCVAAVMRALAKEPDKRFASTDDFSTALDLSEPDGVATSTAAVSSMFTRPVGGSETVLAPASGEVWAPPPMVSPPPVQVAAKKSGAGSAMVLAIVALLVVGAGGLFFFAEHERASRSAMQAAGQGAAGVQQTARTSDEDRRMQAEQDQAAEALAQQLAAEKAQAAPTNVTPGRTAKSDTSGGAQVPSKPQAPVQPQAPPKAPATGGEFEAGRLNALNGTWSGSFNCGHGIVGATLQIIASSDQNVGALFQFAVPNSNPGSYFLRGTFDPGSNRIMTSFTRWKYQPPGYAAGNISGVVDFTRGEFRGNLVLPGCSALSLRKQ